MSKASARRIALTLVLVLLSYVLAIVGRWLLDLVIQNVPSLAGIVERVGGWLIGLVVTVVVLLPLFRIWGFLESKAARPGGNQR